MIAEEEGEGRSRNIAIKEWPQGSVLFISTDGGKAESSSTQGFRLSEDMGWPLYLNMLLSVVSEN